MPKEYKREYYCLIPSCEVYNDCGCAYCINNCEQLHVKRPIDSIPVPSEPKEDLVEPIGINDWVKLGDLLRLIQKNPQWSFNNKYLNLRLDTRLIKNDYHCIIKDNKGTILSLEDIKAGRGLFNRT
jgi:hypothetical protein